MRFALALVVMGFLTSSVSAQFFAPVVGIKTYEASFGNSGPPRPFFSQTPAVNYDIGGSGVGYNVPSPNCTGASCAAGVAAYRVDAVNFKSSTFGVGFPFQLGFNPSPNSYSYTINISQAGPYQITLWTADTSSGGSWNIFLDSVLVTNVPTSNTGNLGTFEPQTSNSFNATLGTHVMKIAWGSGDTQSAVAGDLVAWQGKQAAVPTISSVAMSCGNNCTFVPNTTGTIGNAVATMLNGVFTGTWSLRTSGTDNFGTTCNNYGSNFTIATQPDHTGLVSNGAIASGSYPGVCVVATQAGASGSPFVLAVTITGSSSGVPAPAAAAGFTTLALNADFKSPAYSNKATFINECGATAQFRWYWVLYLTQTHLSCNDFTVTSDGSVPQVLHISVPTNEIPPANISNGNGASFGFPGYAYQGGAPCYTPCFPNEMYVEIKWRTSSASWNQDGNPAHGAHFAFNTAGFNLNPDGSKTVNSNQELDVFETSGGPGASPQFHGQINGILNGSLFFGAEESWNSDATQYHTTAALVTSNGVDTYAFCLYLDGALQGSCPSSNVWPSGVFSQHDNPLYFTIDTFNNFTPIVPLEVWIDHVTVWECASWKTTGCPGTLVTH